ncbi:MAG: nicotinate-nucleotide--dimethylbenzimidazole phosphoribosyltransferase [Planctomycetota bacterium]|nr:nicotinate-nucleotide--dimethylbenzimidazole phosphoribosyltransferase [Planctomycetota bacterium]MDI6787042.1 nicotinate-nucleotide--dimethylbenzimidazole phosphoribosyltransferase [Planctomycetota bacterium]
MDLLNKTIPAIGRLDYALMEKVQKKLDNLTKPQGSLGRLEDLAKHIAGITSKESPSLRHKVVFTLAGDHGVTEDKVSAYPKEVTAQMVYNFLRGGAGINVLARQVGARVIVVDIGIASVLDIKDYRQDITSVFKDCKINLGTRNFTKGPAMTREEAIRSLEAGIRLVEEELPKGADIIGTGDMGIGNTTSSSAITAVLTGKDVADVTGRGTGIDDAIFNNKVSVIKKAIEVNKPDPDDALDVLQKVGGYEIGGIAGIILGSAKNRIPVVIDGFISGAGALIATRLAPQVRNFIIASHCSAERGHKSALDLMGLSPLLDLDLRLGEGTGSAIAMHLCESAVRILNEMATFESAGVSKKID